MNQIDVALTIQLKTKDPRKIYFLIGSTGPIQDLMYKIVDSVKKNLQLDWTKKEDARAAIRLAVKKELRGKVPFSELDNLLKELIE